LRRKRDNLLTGKKQRMALGYLFRVTRMRVRNREVALTGETRENRKISGSLPGGYTGFFPII